MTCDVAHLRCLVDLLRERAECSPDSIALLAPGYLPLTYGRLYHHVDTAVHRLRTLGVGAGTRVALVLPNSPEMAVAALAVAAGAVCAPLTPAYGTREFDAYLADLHATVLVVPAGIDSPARAVAVARHITIIELAPERDTEAGCFTLSGNEQDGSASYAYAGPDDVAVVLQTSGTTTRPKLVPLTQANICRRAHDKCVAHRLVESDRCLNVMPLCHGHGLIHTLLASLMAGASIVCTSDFDATRFFAWLAEFRPTWYTAAPAIHQAILEQAARHQEVIAHCPLRFIRSGTGPLPPYVLAELERTFNAPITETYGLTETSTIACNPLPPCVRKAGSVGMPMGLDVAIMDEEGILLPRGTTGEIVTRGPTVMQGYFNDPIADRSAFTDGWFRTGDQGFLDADGYLFITGRLKEIINRGGEKIAPWEVEDVLMAHPAVMQAVAFAVPHARLGEDISVAVTMRQSPTATADDLRTFAATHLAAFKVPNRVLIVNELPTSPTGKPLRIGLAEKFGLMRSEQVHSQSHTGFMVLPTPLEEVLSGLWAQVLNRDDVGIHDNFFQLGGDSILATQLIARVRDVLHIEVSFRSFFETPSVAGMAKVIEAPSQPSPGRQVPRPQPIPRDNPLPLSFAQQRLWFLEELEPGRAVYNLPLGWRFIGALNVSALEQSLREMVRRHEILRTTFPSLDGQPVQEIAPDLALSLPVVDLQAFTASECERVVQRIANEEAQRPFSLACGPLVRITLVRLSHEDHVLLVTLHHIIFDGWSAEIFWSEFTTLYTAICTGHPASLSSLPFQYADFAIWQRQWLQGDELEAQLAYWKHRLGDAPPVLELPTDRPHPPVQTFQGTRQFLMLPTSLIDRLKALSRQEGVTLFMTLLAAFQTLLYRYTGQTDLVVGTPLAGRTHVATECLLGFFVNTVILRTDLSGNPRFRELLQRVRAVTLGAYDHQDLPFQKLVEALQPERDLSRHPLVQVMVALQPSAPQVMELPGLTAHSVTVDCSTSKFDLTLSVRDTEEGMLATVEYNTDLFDPLTITRLLSHWQTLLQGVLADPEQRLGDVPLLTMVGRQQLQGESDTDNVANYPQDRCVHELFEAQVERKPEAVAVVCDAQQLTYSALNRRANRLAHALRGLGVGPEVCVGLCMDRSVEMMIGILGILKAGGAYVPLDPTYPTERLALMVADARIAVVVTQQPCISRLPLEGVHIVCLDTGWEHVVQQSVANPTREATPDDMVYVLYTSGSTGAPKGVMVEHRQVLAFLYGFEHLAPVEENCIGTSVCPFGFDVFVWECFSILCFGGMLHIIPVDIFSAPEQYAQYLVSHRITSAYIPPALLSDVSSSLAQHEQIALNRLLVGVEPIRQAVLQCFRRLSGQMRIINGYGPTETTICATLFPFRAETQPDDRTPIGTGVRGYEVYLLEANMQPVPMGLAAELYIGGVGLTRGYINHPERTAELFIPHPFSTVPGARLYKTGDWGRFLPDGIMEFLGRRDRQLKIRGHRIELEEIEAALRHHRGVRETVVVARDDTQHGDMRLVAYLAADQALAPTPQVLRAFLQRTLPAYMVPTAFVVLAELPRSRNGKLNLQALPMPDAMLSPATAPFVAPRTPMEQTLARIWAEVLGLKQVGMYDNFFELGGDSILSIRIVARANQLGLRLTPKQLFQHQVISELVAVAGMVPAIQTEQDPVTGPVRLTPIQQWFFEKELPDPHYWNWAMLFEVEPILDFAVLKSAVQHVVMHHDMLRARFRRETDGWKQETAPHAPSSLCMRVDLSDLSEAQQDAAMLKASAQLQASLDLDKGLLVGVAFFDRGSDRCARLFVVIHHLVVDNISWQILLEDLQMVYQQLCAGKMAHLPPKTTSFKHWSEHLAIYAQSAELRQELAYWLAPCAQASRLPVDYPGGMNTVALARNVSASLSAKETNALLSEVRRGYQTQTHEMLLTALAQAFAHWTGEATLFIDLEGHGREEIVEDVDLSRTVGWFTTIFPVLLQFEPGATPTEALKSAKEQLRRIPRRGIGYGVLRYLSQDREVTEKLQALPQAEVCFNHLGQLNQGLSRPLFLQLSHAASGLNRSPGGRRRYLLEVNSRVVDGQLRLDWTYSKGIHQRDTIERLAKGFIEALRTLIVHCHSPDSGAYTPSDFPQMKLRQQELNALMTALGESVEGD